MKKNVIIVVVALLLGAAILAFSIRSFVDNTPADTDTESVSYENPSTENGSPNGETIVSTDGDVPQIEVPETEKETETEKQSDAAETEKPDTAPENTDEVTDVETDAETENETEKVTEADTAPIETEKETEKETEAPEETKTKETEKDTEETTEEVTEKAETTKNDKEGYVDKVEIVTELPEDEHSELLPNLEPAEIILLKPVASGEKTKSNASAVIDYSNTVDGYVMVKYTEETKKGLKVQVTGPETTYTYTIKCGEWVVFPLSDGNGDYKVKIYKNVVDKKYSLELSCSFGVKMKDEFAPFIRPNQYVNYENAVDTMNKAAELVAGKTELLDKVSTIYKFVVKHLVYDYDKAATVKSGYLPDLDKVLKEKKGICFDYAALMTGMLRSQNVPCKLVVGYANEAYHAWISVWSEDTGWIEGVIFFDGVSWQRMDPTFASSSGKNIFDNVQYTAKYFY